MRGLSVLVQPSGHKTYTVFYRINGKATDHKIGGCHEISLKQAREKAAEILVAARSGVSAAKQRMRARSSTLGGFLDSRYSDYHSTMDMGAMMKGIPLPEGLKIGVIETKATSIFDCTASI